MVMIDLTPLDAAFYDRDPVTVARELLGRWLVRRTARGICGGIIIEVEAYLAQGDPACHASRGMTRKNRSMFGHPGRAYVYPIHSRYCMNAVTQSRGVASAVLLRAIDPQLGLTSILQRRRVTKTRDAARGPGRLCEALAIDRGLDGWDLTAGRRLWITLAREPRAAAWPVASSPRIGVTSAENLPLRFFLDGHALVSGPRHFHTRRPA